MVQFSDGVSEVGREKFGAVDDDAWAVCIEGEALGHVAREGFVFKEDTIGRVLCDGAGGCAHRRSRGGVEGGGDEDAEVWRVGEARTARD